MAALLVALAVMAVVMSVALPAWRQANRREKEEELIFRGRQYIRAIQLFQRRFAATYPRRRRYPRQAEVPPQEYKDPMSEDGEFEVLYQGSQLSMSPGLGGRQGATFGQSPGQGRGGTTQGGPGSSFTFDSRSGAITQGGAAGRAGGPRGGVLGVRSKSTEESIRVYNGATHYNEWQFVFVPMPAGPGQGQPGMRRGGPGGQQTPGGMPGGGPGMGGRGGMGGQRGGGPGGPRGGRGPGG